MSIDPNNHDKLVNMHEIQSSIVFECRILHFWNQSTEQYTNRINFHELRVLAPLRVGEVTLLSHASASTKIMSFAKVL